ncbi:Uncharacterized membrane protein [Asanoa ishikariensis]|uniref:Uncharacterized membrane protein n=1 Tax=Asanoa ishikariensis TaxID=137265 RepID=A0A1H3TLR0_9ACTN|nr:Uncharacterized membrane protein [Asanoa ishikariensis]
MALLLGVAGLTHFAVPGPYDSIVPRRLPGPARAWTYASGVAELAVAGAVACRPTRAVGGLAAAALFVAVFPANVKMAIDWRRRSPLARAIAYSRLPLQAPLVWWSMRVAHAAGRPPSTRSHLGNTTEGS